MQFSIVSLSASVIFMASVPLAQATWCNYYYDSACTNPANGNTYFDCANHNVFGSGGGFVRCHATNPNGRDDGGVPVYITRCGDNQCHQNLGSITVPADSGCINTGGAGPWYLEECSAN